tara:strand:+ start:6781 stop:8406 length:1626 start_codon:yes stop_codon:yes gene_type:complete
MAEEKDEIVELPRFEPFGAYRGPSFNSGTINLGLGSGIEDRYGFAALFDPDFIDTEIGLVDGVDPFAVPPPSPSVPRTFDSEETLDISNFKAPETEEEKRGLLGKIGDALSKIPANILNGLLFQAGAKSVGVLPALILSKLTAGAVNDTVTPFVSNALKAIGNTSKDALGNIINFRNPSNQDTTDPVSTDQGAIDQDEEASSNFQGSEDPFRITDFGSSSITEGNDVFSFDDATGFVNESEGFDGTGNTFSEVSDNNNSVSNQTNNEMENQGNTNTSGSNQGSSGMDSRFEEYYKILREQGPQAAEIYAQNLGLFVEGVGSALFGAARQYTDEQLRSLGRSVGINDGSVPTIQEITQAGVVLDPSEERRVMDSLMGSQVAGGREFDPAVLQAGINMNQMMYNRRQPFITAGINASDISPGIRFGGGLAATMEGALPTFADIFKMNQADVQNQFNQDLLEAQREAGDSNRLLQGFNALTQAYGQDLFGLKSNIVDPFGNLISETLSDLFTGRSGPTNNFSNMGSNSNSLFDKDYFELTGTRR